MNPQEINEWVSAAKLAFAAAIDLDELKAARLAHTGDKAPISLASRGLGSLSPEEKASFGKVIGEAKAAIASALADDTARLEIASLDEKGHVLLQVFVRAR